MFVSQSTFSKNYLQLHMLAQTITEEHSIVFYTGVLYKQLEIVNCIQSTNDDE